MKIHHALTPLLLVTLGACAGGASAPYSKTAYHDGESAPAYDAPATTVTSAPASGRSAAPTQHYESYDSAGEAEAAADAPYQPAPREQPRPEQRPGLGTVFGETVTSHVRMKPFVRATSSPFAAVAMYYNDADGVRAHAGYVGQQQLSPFRAHTPAGGISVGLTDQYGNLLSGGMAGGRALVVGAEGQRYNIVVQNQTGGRYEVVVSVDGLDVIDGKPAATAKRGYILEPYSTLTIDGFRTSEYQVAAFRFGRVSQSYAARTSGDRNVGVIGAAFFAEKGSVWTTDELRRRDTADPFPAERSYARPPSY